MKNNGRNNLNEYVFFYMMLFAIYIYIVEIPPNSYLKIHKCIPILIFSHIQTLKYFSFIVIPLQFSQTYLCTCNCDTFHSTLFKVYELKMYCFGLIRPSVSKNHYFLPCVDHRHDFVACRREFTAYLIYKRND